ncbi:MAG: hypothetical protein RL660_76 [Bacteroidota bacterium]|jgi:hypothetical protein
MKQSRKLSLSADNESAQFALRNSPFVLDNRYRMAINSYMPVFFHRLPLHRD